MIPSIAAGQSISVEVVVGGGGGGGKEPLLIVWHWVHFHI
jgi:hypothetical protein